MELNLESLTPLNCLSYANEATCSETSSCSRDYSFQYTVTACCFVTSQSPPPPVVTHHHQTPRHHCFLPPIASTPTSTCHHLHQETPVATSSFSLYRQATQIPASVSVDRPPGGFSLPPLIFPVEIRQNIIDWDTNMELNSCCN
ncbi:unnamed protein product [Lactuca saligna]|uniref:Uncharacterized protein n=1 Tax=Lactuca saligna TaxID=75948 RepID=A0AA35VY08_LACSI|nr:unnamed protein product [Lactuca saligna]